MLDEESVETCRVIVPVAEGSSTAPGRVAELAKVTTAIPVPDAATIAAVPDGVNVADTVAVGDAVIAGSRVEVPEPERTATAATVCDAETARGGMPLEDFEIVGVTLAVFELEGVTLGLAPRESEDVGDADGVDDRVAVAESDGESVVEAVAVLDAVGVFEAVSDPDALDVAVSLAVPLLVSSALGLVLALAPFVNEEVGVLVSERLRL